MTRRREGVGGFNVSGDGNQVAIADGKNAHASNSVSWAAAEDDLTPIEGELAQLRVQLEELRDQLAPEVAAAAELEARALQEEILQEQPDAGEITRRLGRLSLLLGGVAGLAETVGRLGHALRGLIGLG